MTHRIFYSWQSDLPNATNRGFIGSALEKAAKAIRADESIHVEPVIDRDTLGVPGSPDIAEAIFSKIDGAQAFIGDVSIINSASDTRPTPNPNVLVELGYALRTLSDQRLVLVVNTAYGPPEMLPFDLRMRRILAYSMPESETSRADERNRLAKGLERALRVILAESHVPPSSYPQLPLDQELFKKISQDILPSDGAIRILREHDYGGAFRYDDHKDLHNFLETRHHPQFEFFDPEMEDLRQRLLESVRAFRNLLGLKTFPVTGRSDLGRLPRLDDLESIRLLAHRAKDEDDFKRLKAEREARLIETQRKLNDLATEVTTTYDEFIKHGRSRLLV